MEHKTVMTCQINEPQDAYLSLWNIIQHISVAAGVDAKNNNIDCNELLNRIYTLNKRDNAVSVAQKMEKHAICPVCEKLITPIKFVNFCSWCGQRLDFGGKL